MSLYDCVFNCNVSILYHPSTHFVQFVLHLRLLIPITHFHISFYPIPFLYRTYLPKKSNKTKSKKETSVSRKQTREKVTDVENKIYMKEVRQWKKKMTKNTEEYN